MKFPFLILIAIMFNLMAFSQNNQGYFNYDSVYISLDTYKLEKNKLDEFTDSLENEYSLMIKDYENLIRYGLPHNTKVNQNELNRMQDSLMNLEIKIGEFQQSIQGLIQQKEDEIKANFNMKLEIAIIPFCKENEIELLLNKDAIFYCKDCINYTDELTEYLNSL